MAFDSIDMMAKDYGGRPSTRGRIYFGIRRINNFKSLVHQTQGFWRISELLRIKGIAGIFFPAHMYHACDRARIQKQHRGNYYNKAKESSPGSLKYDKEWVY